MKFKDILNDKVVYIQYFGEYHCYDYKIIVQHKDKYCLIEYSDGNSGYSPFVINSVDKEFIYVFFSQYDDNWKKYFVKLNVESNKKFKNQVNFEYHQEYLEKDIILLDYKDIEKYARKS